MAEVAETERPEIARPNTELDNGRRSRFLQSPAAKGVLLVIILLLAVGGFFVWSYYSVRETTDDAEIEGHIHPISAKVSGTIVSVNIKENQNVQQDAVLVQIDPKDYQVALDRAQADLAESQALLDASRVDVPMTATTSSSQFSGAEATVQEARANATSSEKEVPEAGDRLRSAQAKLREMQANYQKAQRDLERMQKLIAKEEISQQQFDAFTAAAESQRASLDSAQADVSAAEEGLHVAESHVARDSAKVAQAQAAAQGANTAPQQMAMSRSRAESAAARVQMAKAALDQAQLNLQYTTIVAPIGGLISKKNVEVGQIVQAGQPLFAIVPLEDTWVEANFKETQLKNIRLGQPVIVSVDAFGGRKFKAYVESIAAATGAKFSLLPPENATGNYVKVVQRIPVRILFDKGEDPEHILRPGMSVVPTVMTK